MNYDKHITGAMAKIRQIRPVKIKYRRGDDFIQLVATVGQTAFEQVDADGVTQEFISRDFIFDACGLELGGSGVTPVDGDQITEIASGITYQVLPRATFPSWKYSDIGQTQIRVHTKRRDD